MCLSKPWLRAIVAYQLACIALIISGCAGKTAGRGKMSVVASFYPLAWAASKVGSDRVTVTNLTPPGGEPHDLSLTARQRTDVADASLIVLLGKGFQPEVERAARDAKGKIIDATKDLQQLGSKEKGLEADPHVWLDPVMMTSIVQSIAGALAESNPSGRTGYLARASAVKASLIELDDSFRKGLANCAMATIVTTHEAFTYLATRYGLKEVGLTGLTPEAEPSAANIEKVRQSALRGEVGAIFFEATDEGRRIGKSIAKDVGVPAYGLHTLESDPAPRDYLSQMRENLGQLRKGLKCA